MTTTEPYDLDLPRLLEISGRLGVRVWRADERGELHPIQGPPQAVVPGVNVTSPTRPPGARRRSEGRERVSYPRRDRPAPGTTSPNRTDRKAQL